MLFGILIALGIVVLVLLAAYLYLSRAPLCQEEQLPKRKLIFREKLCADSGVDAFVREVAKEVTSVKAAKDLLARKDDKGAYVNKIAVLYFDSPKTVSNLHNCLVCVGLLCEKDAHTEEIEAELTKTGFTTRMIEYTRGVVIRAPHHTEGGVFNYQTYRVRGLEVYPTFERYFAGNQDMKEQLGDEFYFSELVDPAGTVFYRPIYRCQAFDISSLPHGDSKQKTE